MIEFEKNSVDAYPTEIKEWVNTIKLGDDITMIGSVAYRSLEQYADIDLLENLHVSPTFNSYDYYRMLLNCIKKMQNKGALFSDIKNGTLEKYKVLKQFLGSIHMGVVSGYDGRNLKSFINQMKINEEIRSELNDIVNKYEQTEDLKDWEDLAEYIRNLYTIHWTNTEFNNMYKYGPSGENIQLMDYILKEGLKLDMFIMVSGNWIEISAVYNIMCGNVPVNFKPLSQEEIYASISMNAEKFLYSPLFGSTYKGLKRMWILSRMNEDVENGTILAELINSDVNNMYISKSYLESMALIVGKGYPVDLTKPKSNIKWLLSHCTSIHFDIDMVFGLIDRAKSVEDFYGIKSFISHMVNEYAQIWISDMKFNPVIQKYLKNCHDYEHFNF